MSGFKAIVKRISVMLFVALFVLDSVNYGVLNAAAAEQTDTVCPNHPQHTAECGYVEAVEGADCTHECSEESGCTGEEGCQHVHDESCGYREAAEGQPCTHSCELCQDETEEAAGEDTVTDPSGSEMLASDEETHVHNGIEFTAWSSTGGILAAGNYYLTGDVTLASGISIQGNIVVNICLNGHTIDLNRFVIYLNSGATLNIYDCGTEGKITGGIGYYNNSQKGGAIYVKSSTVNLYGGSIEGNSAVWGGAIFIDASENMKSTVNMYDGATIKNNTATSGGGGIEVEDERSVFNMYGGSIIDNKVTDSASTPEKNKVHKGGGVHFNKGTMKIAGTVNISGNTVAGVENNVYLRAGKTITIESVGEGSRIGVSAYNIENDSNLDKVIITQNYNKISTDDVYYFFLDKTHDKSHYALTNNGSELQIKKHSHTWAYRQEGDSTVYAYCTTDESHCGYYGEDSADLPLTITAESPVTYTPAGYSGAALDADELAAFNDATGNNLSNDDIVYYTDEALTAKTTTEDGAEAEGKAPANVGTYYAAVKIGDAVAKAAFTIEQAQVAVTEPTAADFLTENGTAQQLVNAGTTDGGTLYYSLNGTDWTTDASGITGTDAGSYTVYWKLDGGRNYKDMPQQTITVEIQSSVAPEISGIKDGGIYCEDVTVSVTDENQDLEKVTLDETEVTLVDGKFTIKADGKKHIIKAEDAAGHVIEYTVTVYKGHDFTNPVYTETGRDGNVITEEAPCGHGCGKTIVRKIKEGQTISEGFSSSDGSTTGSLTADAKAADGAPEVSVSGLNIEVAKTLLTPEEQSQLDQKDMQVYLQTQKVEDEAVSSDDKTMTEQQAGEKNLTQGIYLDLSMWKKIGDDDATPVGSVELSKELNITLTLPEELKAPAGKKRTYYVIRVHGTQATVLPAQLTGSDISFATDRFSTYSIWYTETNTNTNTNASTSSGSSDSSSTAPKPSEDYKIPLNNANTINVEAQIKDGKAALSEITADTLDKIVNGTSGESQTDTIVIDLSGAKQDVTGVTISKTSVEALAKAVAENKNGIETVTIVLSKATITLDGKILDTLAEQAKGTQIELGIADTEQKNLNDVQQEALKQYQVAKTFGVYFTSNGQRISDFNGGKAVVSIDFTPETGKDVRYYHVVYVADNGEIIRYKTKYENGKLIFTTSLFSDYVIIYDTSEKNETDSSSDGTNKTWNTTFGKLRLRATASTKSTNKLVWKAVAGADGYVVYGSKCNANGKTYKLKQKTVIAGKNKTTWTDTGLQKKTYYKYYVKAYKLVDGRKVFLAKSRVIHVTTAGGKYTNPATVKVNKANVTAAPGKTYTIKASQVIKNGSLKDHAGIRYESSNKNVASVSSKGVITAKKAGTCTIFVYAQNGKYKKVTVTVK